MDLFAGSGSIGIEALSRGANLVYFVDNSLKSIRLINENLKLLNQDYDNKHSSKSIIKVYKSDVVDFLKNQSNVIFDIIFIDPPYKINPEIMHNIFKILSTGKIINKDSIVIYEFFFKKDIEFEISNLKIIKKSNFGDKTVVYLSL